MAILDQFSQAEILEIKAELQAMDFHGQKREICADGMKRVEELCGTKEYKCLNKWRVIQILYKLCDLTLSNFKVPDSKARRPMCSAGVNVDPNTYKDMFNDLVNVLDKYWKP